MARMNKSLPSAITCLVLGVAISITLIYSLLILLYSWMVEDNIFNRLVAAEADFIEQSYQQSGTLPQPRSGFVTLHRNWQDMPQELIDARKRKQDRIEFDLNDGSTVHIHVLQLEGIDYVLMAKVDDFEVSKEYLPNLLGWLALLALAGAALVSIIAFVIGRRLTRPIKKLADQVSCLPTESNGATFANNYPDNEIRVLANAVETSFFNLQDALQREINFTRDVSHEIRTPISILKNLLDSRSHSQQLTPSDYQQAQRAIFELEKVTHTLLALARNESKQKSELDMTQLVENTLLEHFELNNSEKGQKLSLQLSLQEGIHLHANRNLTQILLNNIISNIVQYATGSDVEIRLTSTSISFINHTTTPVPVQPEAAGVKAQLSTGIGQGLNLIERICAVNHWQMETHSSPTVPLNSEHSSSKETTSAFKLTVHFNPT
ncbi:sensor histidine kinase [Corallincola holothuriorum]|uniref:histidine kinase n=2 Tax=Corallincola holothuriorum TaxID=2282215 RepID=A0A368NMG6_9GAMM|nr:sensor histidine kinase [Corallincola holothuriorum]